MRAVLVLLLAARLAAPLEDDTLYAAGADLITHDKVAAWAEQIVSQLEAYERRALDRDRLATSLAGPTAPRDAAALVGEAAGAVAAVAASRAAAAEGIARAAERLASAGPGRPPGDYTFFPSVELDRYKSSHMNELDNTLPCKKNHTCRSYRPLHLESSSQFHAHITRQISSVHVPVEIFDCDDRVLPNIHRTEALDFEFRRNYAHDATFSWQYYCSARGFMRHYPGAAWSSMAGAPEGQDNEEDEDKEPDPFDCRLRTWYVEASGAPRDILVLLDATGSITTPKQQLAYALLRELLTALTDDDHVNVLRFNREWGVRSPIFCFEDMLVPANHINVAALLHNMTKFRSHNDTHLPNVLATAVAILNASRHRTDDPIACQQALILIADDVPVNLTEVMRLLDPEGRVRVFVFIMGIGNMFTAYGENLACDTDGYFAQLEGPNDVTEQARRVLRVLERPAVLHHQKYPSSNSQRDPPVWSDLYAHVQDSRYGTQRWRMKEKAEQKNRYMRLRRDKEGFLSPEQHEFDYQNNQFVTTLGHYSEEDSVPYQLMISVAVPAYDPTMWENHTVQLMEELQRNSTRKERVARLLGVAGVDIPIADLRMRLPYHKLGPGGSLFLIDHRGNAILHDDLRPVVEDNILKPGYRTVDLLDVELPDDNREPRQYSPNVVQLRVAHGTRHYAWRRVRGTSYTAVVSLPAPAADTSLPPAPAREPASAATQAVAALNDTEFSVQSDWLYCRYLERRFDRPADEVLHFLRRIAEEPDFQYQQLRYSIHRLPPALLDMPYMCNKELIARLAWEARATAWFSSLEEDERFAESEGTHGAECALGTSTVFVATPGGLTRWRHRLVPGDGPEAIRSADAGGPAEAWYARAAAAGPGTLVVHAPLAPRSPRRSLTAARALGAAQPLAAELGVAGFHFRASHLTALMASVTAPLCEGAGVGAECAVSCADDGWRCLLVDEAGWVVADSRRPARGHLATAHAPAMRQLLAAGVFRRRWLHDYQAVCFPPMNHGKGCSANRTGPPGARAWRWLAEALRCVVLGAHDVLHALLLLAVGGAAADTKVEKQKRKVRVRKDFDREKWEKLFDARVCVNLTQPATCDRRRAFYMLQSDAGARLARQRVSCDNQSLVGAPVPRTNLLLLALYTLCPDPETDPPLEDPTHNLEVEPPGAPTEPMESRLACGRHSAPSRLTARGPAAACHTHSRAQEVEFRQCGPHVADEGKMAAAARSAATKSTVLEYIVGVITMAVVGVLLT